MKFGGLAPARVANANGSASRAHGQEALQHCQTPPVRLQGLLVEEYARHDQAVGEEPDPRVFEEDPDVRKPVACAVIRPGPKDRAGKSGHESTRQSQTPTCICHDKQVKRAYADFIGCDPIKGENGTEQNGHVKVTSRWI